MSKPKIYISLSLPKTGTTYLENLLSQFKGFLSPSIKEPSFFFQGNPAVGSIIKKVLVKGNFNKGYEWYLSLFPQRKDATLLDMSTQYWLYPEEVISEASKNYSPVFLYIKRDPLEQIISYVTHLRRGYIPDRSLEKLCAEDPIYFEYLQQMYLYQSKWESLANKYQEFSFIEVDFEILKTLPEKVLRSFIDDEAQLLSLNYDVEKNPKSTPMWKMLNRILFSGVVRKLGRALPNVLYDFLINLRKSVVKKNLRKGEGSLYNEDVAFIKSHFKV